VSGRSRRLAWSAVFVASATMVSRVVGLVREVVVAGAYGVDPFYNAFVSVNAVPNTIRQLFADAAISAAFVPVLVALLAAGDLARARRVTGALVGFMLLVVGIVTLVLIAAAGPIVRTLFPELTATPEAAAAAAEYLRIVVPTILVLSLAGVVTGVLLAHERFVMPAVVSIVWNLVIISFVSLWQASWGVSALAWGTLAGTAAELVILVWAMHAMGEPLRVNFHFADRQFRRVLTLIVPIAITLGLLNFNALIDLFFAQFVGSSAAAELHYAFRLYTLPQGIFAVTIGTVLFPSLARYVAQKDAVRFRETISTGVRQTVFVSLPFVAWFMVAAEPIVRVVFQRGAFSAGDTAAVAPVLAALSAGLVFANVNMMFNRSFQSMQRVWLPLYVGLANLALNAALDWVLLVPLGTAGIALSTSLVSMFNTVVLAYLLRREIGSDEGRRIGLAAGKALACALALAAAAAVTWWVLSGLVGDGFVEVLVALTATVAVSGAAYVGAARLLRVEELGLVWGLLRRRVRRAAPGA
jgi:putative peptidoglycan lipid II flippase